MKIFNILFLLSLLTFSSAGVRSAADESQEILSLGEKWARHLETGDTRAMGRFYTIDAVMLPPSSEILSNPDDIKSYWELLKGVGVSNYAIYPVALRVEGDTAYQTALWEAVRYNSEGEPIKLQGNISNVLVKQEDGSWKIKLQSWN